VTSNARHTLGRSQSPLLCSGRASTYLKRTKNLTAVPPNRMLWLVAKPNGVVQHNRYGSFACSRRVGLAQSAVPGGFD
jgi:hypothetical protein